MDDKSVKHEITLKLEGYDAEAVQYRILGMVVGRLVGDLKPRIEDLVKFEIRAILVQELRPTVKEAADKAIAEFNPTGVVERVITNGLWRGSHGNIRSLDEHVSDEVHRIVDEELRKNEAKIRESVVRAITGFAKENK